MESIAKLLFSHLMALTVRIRSLNCSSGTNFLADSHRRRRIATILGAAIFKAYKALKHLPGGLVRARSEMVELALPEISPEQVAEAKRIVEPTKDDRGANFMKLVRSYRTLDVAARQRKPHNVEVQVLTLGRNAA